MTKFLNNADIKGYIAQTAVTSYLLKADSTGRLVAAIAGTDYQAPTTALLPSGGTAGQILAKIDGTNYNAQWIDNFAQQIKYDVKLGAALSKGTPVYVSSANGTNIIVSASSNATEATSSKTLGLLETGGALNDIVKVVSDGLLSGLNTSTATIGDPVWLGVNGALIFGLANKPSAPAHLVYIGAVTRVHATNGEIFIKVQNGFELDELHNVALSSVSDGQGLFYESATSLWKNKTIASVLGYTPANGANYLPLTGGTLTGDLTLSGTNPRLYFTDTDNNPDYFISNTDGTFTIYDVTNSVGRFKIYSGGNAEFSANVSINGDQKFQINGYNSATAFITSNVGYNSNYNGIGIYSNPTNANSLPAWYLDLGGLDGVTNNPDAFSILRKPSGGSLAKLLAVLSSGQLRLNTYTTSTSFSGTAAGYLAFDSSGNVITVAGVAATDNTKLPLAGGTMTGAIQLNNGVAIRDQNGDWILGKYNGDVSLGSSSITNSINFNSATASTFAYRGNAILHAGNYNSYSPTLTGGGASGSWGISVTGSAGSVAWSGVTGKPTTLSGYGITDGLYTTTSDFTTAGAGWYRVATTGGDGRGYYYVEVYTTGGNHNPSYLRIEAMGDWGSDKLIAAYTDTGFPANNVRITRGASNTFLEVYFTTTILGASMRVTRLGFNSATTPYSGSLPGGGDTVKESLSITSKLNSYSNSSSVFRFNNSSNNAYLTGNSDWGFRVVNDSGYIQFGPANPTWAHIYSGLPFYFNQNLFVNGTQVVTNSGTWGINISGNSITTSQTNFSNLTIGGAQVWYNSGSWLGDLASYGFTRAWGLSMSGGSEFVLLYKNGQGYTLVDGSYYAYEGGGFYSSSNSAGNTLLGFYADTTSSVNFNTATVKANGNTIWHAGNMDAPNKSGTSYYQANTWIQFNGGYGIYFPNNYGLHFYPNDGGTYGAARINGTKNGWKGIYFDSGNTLMMNNNESGHYQDGYGWKWRWYNGSMYISTNSYGGGSEYTIWHSGNASRAGNSNLMYYAGFTLDANSMPSNSTGFTYSQNAPYTGPIAKFSEDGYPLQLNATYSGGTSIAYRTRNGDAGSWNNWYAFITSANIGSQSVNYANYSGYTSGYSTSVELSGRIWFNGSGNHNVSMYESYGIVMNCVSHPWHVQVLNGSLLVGISASGANYGTGHLYTNGFIRPSGDYGLYSQDYGGYFRRNTYSYGTWESTGYAKNGWGGYVNNNNYIVSWMLNTSGDFGFLTENGNWWNLFYNNGNNCWGIGTDNTYSGDGFRCIKYGSAQYGWTTWSDRRAKENISTITGALDKVLNMRGVYFNYIIDEAKNKRVGFIAQELQQALPEAVRYAEEIDEYNVEYGQIVSVLAEAVKEHYAKTVAQQIEIDALKTQLQTLLN